MLSYCMGFSLNYKIVAAEILENLKCELSINKAGLIDERSNILEQIDFR